MRTRDRVALLAAVAALAACKKQEPPPPEAPRPVTVVELKTMDPVKPLQISGSVRSWNEQSVSFEVAGPVSFVVEETTNLAGRWLEGTNVIDRGDVLARLNDREFTIDRDAALANLAVAQADLELAKTQLAELLPAQLRAAEANQHRAKAEYDRFVEARKTNAVSELDVIQHKADFEQRVAETDEAEAQIESKKVELLSLQARVDQAGESVAKAEYDIERCTLYAPFAGEVSRVFIEAGGYANVSDAVAHLVMMDPIKVDVAVSAERATQLRIGDPVKLYPLVGGEAFGHVYEKATSADAETRTFRVSVLVRNSRVVPGVAADSPLRKLSRVEFFSRPQRLDEADPNSAWAVAERRALRQDDKGYFVWASNELQRGESLDVARPVLTFGKVRVEPGDVRRNFRGLFIARALADPGPLDGDWVIAMDAPDDFAGGETLVSLRNWQLQPGQIVPVVLGGQTPKPGLFVPMRALTQTGEGQNVIFVAQDGIARRVGVQVIESVAELVRVDVTDASKADLLKDGSRVIVDLVHFLVDGEPVRVVRTRKLVP